MDILPRIKQLSRTAVLAVLAFFVGVSFFCLTPRQTAEAMGAIKPSERPCINVGIIVETHNIVDAKTFENSFVYLHCQKIANYLGWRYTYTFNKEAELVRMLQSGDIDVIVGGFENPAYDDILIHTTLSTGCAPYCLMTLAEDRARIGKTDFSGTRIGVEADSFAHHFYQSRVATLGLVCDIVPIESRAALYDALRAKTIDAVFDSPRNASTQPKGSIKKTSDILVMRPFYLFCSKDRPDLIETLDGVLREIRADEPNFFQDAHDHFLRTFLMSDASRTARADSWLSRHDTLRVGYSPIYVPLTCQDAEAPVFGGVFHDVLGRICKEHGLELAAKPYSTHDELIAALHNGDVDVVAPVLHDIRHAEEDFTAISNIVLTTDIRLLYRAGKLPHRPMRVALTDLDYMMHRIIREHPEAFHGVSFKTPEEVFSALEKGTVDAILVNELFYVCDLNAHPDRYDGLYVAPLDGHSFSLCLAVAKGNVGLMHIINSDLAKTDDIFLQHSIIEHARLDQEESLDAFFHRHFKKIVLFGVLLVSILVGASYFSAIMRKKNIALSKAIEAADIANSAKSRFLFNMSHDLRTPMNAIIGYTELALRHEGNATLLHEAIMNIRTASAHLLNIINEVLDMSRIESGKATLHPTAISIPEILDSARPMLQPLTEQKKQTLIIDSTNAVHDLVYVDVQKAQQILINLAGNSVKFTPEGGTITISVEADHEATAAQTKNAKRPTDADASKPLKVAMYYMRVTDTGIGMTPEFLSRVFEPFEREYSQEQSMQTGTGLGLAITKQFTELMGGTIDVTSKVGEGSIFTITVPLYYETIEAKEESATSPTSVATAAGGAATDTTGATKETPSKPFAGERVLFVEDNALNRNLGILLLQDLGLTIDAATNGEEAVNAMIAAEDGAYAAVLMDIRMPVMDGLQATQAIRAEAREYLRTVPIIALTANAFQEDIDHCMAAGMNAHLAKPMDMERLTKLLQSFLKKE